MGHGAGEGQARAFASRFQDGVECARVGQRKAGSYWCMILATLRHCAPHKNQAYQRLCPLSFVSQGVHDGEFGSGFSNANFCKLLRGFAYLPHSLLNGPPSWLRHRGSPCPCCPSACLSCALVLLSCADIPPQTTPNPRIASNLTFPSPAAHRV